jgi:pimeloyl-ACP methyl ester carboxylesterase
VTATSAGPPGLNAHRGGSGEPLVLLHGIGLSIRTWRPVLPALEREHDVLALDLPGFGESPPLAPGTRSTVPAIADAVEDELGASGLERPHLAGNSLGGWVALELARRGRARSVVAFAPAGLWSGWEVPYTRAMLRLHRAGAALLSPQAERLLRPTALRAALLGLAYGRPWRVGPADAVYTERALAAAPGWRETLEWMLSHNADGLDELRVPVLIVWGKRDRVLPPRQGPRYAHAIPGAELRIVAGLGHIPMSDDPELVARTIVAATGKRSEAG